MHTATTMRLDDDCYHSDDPVDYASSPISFPQKLYILLEDNESDLIQWSLNGLCFRIRDPDRFAKETVPKYFKQSKLTSFQRQLNLYGFRRIARGEDVGCYFHPKFHQGRKDMLKEIKRLPPKGSLMTYEEVLESQARLGAKRKPSESLQAVPRRAFSSGAVNYMSYPVPPPTTHYTLTAMVPSAPRYIVSDDSSNDTSSICSWTSDCDSADLVNSLETEDFDDLFSLSHIDFDSDCDASLVDAVEPKEYIPTYEEAVIYGLIHQ